MLGFIKLHLNSIDGYAKSLKIRQVSILYTGFIINLVLGLFNSMILSRLLGTIGFGDYKYVLNLFQLFASILFFGFYVSGSRLLALSHDSSYTKSLKGALLFLTIILSVLLILISSTFSLYQKYSNAPHLAILFIILSPLLFGYQIKSMLENSFQGENKIRKLTALHVLPSLIFLLIITYFYFAKTKLSSTIAIASQLSVICLTGLILIWKDNYSIKPDLVRNGLKAIWVENRLYGRHVYFGSLMTVSTRYLTPVIISLFSITNIDVGFYTLALTIATPLGMIPAVTGTVLFKSFAQQDKLSSNVWRVIWISTILIMVIFLLLINPTVNLFYTAEFSEVSSLAKWIAIGTSLHGIGDVLGKFLSAHGQGIQLRNNAMVTGLYTLLSSVLFIKMFGVSGAIIAKVTSDCIYLSIMYFYYKKFTKDERLVQ